jgi:hypothetical protein
LAEWDTTEDARAWIDANDSLVYFLSHGEIGRPSFSVIHEDEAEEGPDCLPGRKHDWHVAKDDIPAEDMEKLWENDTEYDHDDGTAVEIWSRYIDAGGRRYGDHYAVSTLAISRACGEMDQIYWDNAYYSVEDLD